jgi:formylmethanofuran dehydrogenase subunit B
MTASIDGLACSLEEAQSKAAELLGNSRAAVVAGMGTDIAGARAAVTLAQQIGASIDHVDAQAWLANGDVMRRAGWIVTTPLQVRARADMMLVIRPHLPDCDRQLVLGGMIRRICRLGRADGSSLLSRLAALRTLVGGHRLDNEDTALRVLASALTSAKFGAVLWHRTIDTLEIEMLCGLIDDLNKTTRFAGLPLAIGNNAEGVAQVLTWRTGLPMRTGFAGAVPLHDPWRFNASRLVAEGESDAVVWVSAFAAISPPWRAGVPTVALVKPGTVFDTPPQVLIEIGRPGRDHDALLFDHGLGGIAFAAASAPSDAIRAADALTAITRKLPG